MAAEEGGEGSNGCVIQGLSAFPKGEKRNKPQGARQEKRLEVERMKAKMTGTEKEASRVEKLRRMVETEREKVAGYQQIIELYSGYIAILLEKLGATEENGVAITSAEVDGAMKKYETRGYTKDGAVSLFIAEKS